MYAYKASEFECAQTSISLSELMSAFTFALDLTEGQPEGHSLRACYIACRLAEVIGLSELERKTVFYGTMLKDLGCSSNAARIAETYLTDDRTFKRDFKLIAPGLWPALAFVFNKTGTGHSIAERARAIANILRNGPEIARSLIETRCTRGADVARRLRFPEPVAETILALDEHWDGSGKPMGLSGHDIPLPARLALLGQIAEVFFTSGGPEAARQEIKRHRGLWLDPELCHAFEVLSRSPDFWRELASPDIQERILDFDEDRMSVDEDYLDDIALAFGEVIDAKSPYTAGHSERVGIYFDALAQHCGLEGADLRSMRRAAILHDVGKLGVSSSVLEKPGKLDVDEWKSMQTHAAHTADILGRIRPFREMALIAGAHHEKLDGTGYPRGLDAVMIRPATRMITVCDFFDALTADRPYRAAMPAEKALSIMGEQVGSAIDSECFSNFRQLVLLGRIGPEQGSIAKPSGKVF